MKLILMKDEGDDAGVVVDVFEDVHEQDFRHPLVRQDLANWLVHALKLPGAAPNVTRGDWKGEAE